jgi:outer membrane protein assembly factor BamB
MAVIGRRVFVTGASGGRGANLEDYATVAYDAVTGARLWVRRYNGPADRRNSSHVVAVSPGGQVVVRDRVQLRPGLRAGLRDDRVQRGDRSTAMGEPLQRPGQAR